MLRQAKQRVDVMSTGLLVFVGRPAHNESLARLFKGCQEIVL